MLVIHFGAECLVGSVGIVGNIHVGPGLAVVVPVGSGLVEHQLAPLVLVGAAIGFALRVPIGIARAVLESDFVAHSIVALGMLETDDVVRHGAMRTAAGDLDRCTVPDGFVLVP